jgi:DNA-binding CsgD family transcriptional regulator
MENKKTPTKHAQKGLWFSMVLFVLVAILIAWDIAWDLATGVTISHIIIELSMMLAAMIGAFYFWNWLKVARRMESNQQRDLKKAHAEITHWQEETRDLLQNLRKVIDKQFALWKFSPTEREIGFYLLNGLSLKQIAELRDSTDKSVKQQAYLLYRKAGLSGRAELSAFFLGGLLDPETTPGKKTDEAEPREI